MAFNSAYKISKTSLEDFDLVISLAKKFDLDIENANQSQFLVVKKDAQIVGFGRLIDHNDFFEIATLGVIEEKQNHGVGSAIVKQLISMCPGELFLVTVIPLFFSKLGFVETKTFSPVFTKKINFCKDFHFEDEEIKVMKLKR